METFAAVRLDIDSWRWNGVPFFILARKCLPTTTTEVLVDLKRPPVTKLAHGNVNYLRLRLGPEGSISMGVCVKKPGEAMISQLSEMTLIHHPSADEMGAYERLLGDAMEGDTPERNADFLSGTFRRRVSLGSRLAGRTR